MADIEKNNQLELVLKSWKEGHILCWFSAKETLVAKKPIMSRVGKVVITDG
jgi:hypothetical protein